MEVDLKVDLDFIWSFRVWSWKEQSVLRKRGWSEKGLWWGRGRGRGGGEWGSMAEAEGVGERVGAEF